MEHFKLKDYKIRKGVLISPFNELMTPLSKDLAWCTGRCPEYLWIGLILDSYERLEAINKCLFITNKLYEIEPNLLVPAWSEIIKMDSSKQEKFFSFLSTYIPPEILAPMTSVTTFSNSPTFIKFFTSTLPLKERIKALINLMNNISNIADEIVIKKYVYEE